MHIAASHALVSHLLPTVAWWRWTVLILPMWRQSSLPQRTAAAASSRLNVQGFNLPVYLLTDSDMAKPDGATAIVGGKEQEWLELEAGACSYEENLLPPFFNTLTQYVEMDNSTFACPGISTVLSLKHPAGRCWILMNCSRRY